MYICDKCDGADLSLIRSPIIDTAAGCSLHDATAPGGSTSTPATPLDSDGAGASHAETPDKNLAPISNSAAASSNTPGHAESLSQPVGALPNAPSLSFTASIVQDIISKLIPCTDATDRDSRCRSYDVQVPQLPIPLPTPTMLFLEPTSIPALLPQPLPTRRKTPTDLPSPTKGRIAKVSRNHCYLRMTLIYLRGSRLWSDIYAKLR